jgi:hypothetical protein
MATSSLVLAILTVVMVKQGTYTILVKVRFRMFLGRHRDLVDCLSCLSPFVLLLPKLIIWLTNLSILSTMATEKHSKSDFDQDRIRSLLHHYHSDSAYTQLVSFYIYLFVHFNKIFVCPCQIPCFSLFATTDRAWLIIWFQTRITRHVLLEEQDSPRILLEIVFFILYHYTFLHVVSSVFIFIYVYPSVRRHADDFRLCRT